MLKHELQQSPRPMVQSLEFTLQRVVASARLILCMTAACLSGRELSAQTAQTPPPTKVEIAAVHEQGFSLSDALSAEEWRRTEASVDRGLEWMEQTQAANGSYAAIPAAQPAVTSLAVLAYLSRGHVPGVGRYGDSLNRAIDFVLSCQKEDGLLSESTPEPRHYDKTASHGASYNHAIAGLMLAEAYGMTDSRRSLLIKESVSKALLWTRALQTRPKRHPEEMGGWRYVRLRWSEENADSDLSVTGWQLLFLRAAKNAEFDVPKQHIDEAMRYVDSCWDDQTGQFYYSMLESEKRTSRGVMGVGILSLSLAGRHQTKIAQRAGDHLLKFPFQHFGGGYGSGDRFFYSVYYCSQAMAQLGGRHWKEFFPPLVDVLLTSQQENGAWPPEPRRGDAVFGNVYTTALAVLALTPPYQILPVYQR